MNSFNVKELLDFLSNPETAEQKDLRLKKELQQRILNRLDSNPYFYFETGDYKKLPELKEVPKQIQKVKEVPKTTRFQKIKQFLTFKKEEGTNGENEIRSKDDGNH